MVPAMSSSSPLVTIAARPGTSLNGGMPPDTYRDWRPVTVRAKSRETLAVGVRNLKAHLPQALRLVARGDARVVVRRHRERMGALVPMPDYWFLVMLEEELRRQGWHPVGRRIGAPEVAAAVVELRERAAAAERKRLAQLKHAEAAERKRFAEERREEAAPRRRAAAQRLIGR